MTMINYDGRCFRSVSNTDNGEVDGATYFEYHQEGDIVWATYSGGAVRFGTLIALADEEGKLDMRYQHINEAGVLRTGVCRSEPEVLPDGRIRLRERWRWTSGNRSAGRSVVEEVRQERG